MGPRSTEVSMNQVSKVVVYSFSRFARSTRHLLDALEFFKKNNVEFISLSEKLRLIVQWARPSLQ